MTLLETRALRFTYPDGTEALCGIDLRVEAGSVLALLGPNGSGKSTLFHHLNGLLQPTAGEVLLRDQPLSGLPAAEVHRTVGLVFQDPDSQLFAPTVAEDVAFGPRNLGLSEGEVSRRVSDALEMVELLPLARKAVHALSYGQRKRAALAGVLAMQPEALLLDEPTAGLDPVGAEHLMQLLARLNHEQGMTILLGTHDVDVVPAFADHILILKGGELLASGAPREVFAQTAAIEAARLRLPYVTQLVQSLRLELGETGHPLPLTLSEAREEITRMFRQQGSKPPAAK